MNANLPSTACWFKCCRPGGTQAISGWRPGRLFQFSHDHLEYESGPGPIPVGVILDEETRKVLSIPVELICFATCPQGERDNVTIER